MLIKHLLVEGYEKVLFCEAPKVGLKSYIAIHSTKRGPALGGCRIWPYKNEEEALEDVLRLARGMTYKAALANLNLGGGKAVIIGDSRCQKTPELLEAFGQFVNLLEGSYITAEDVGTNSQDMSYIKRKTPYVAGLKKEEGGSGDPSPYTVLGLLAGIRACQELLLPQKKLKDLKIAVQGLGSVGLKLAEHLKKTGVRLYITDIDLKLAEEVSNTMGIPFVKPEDIYSCEVDIFAPCALGGILNEHTVSLLKCMAVIGSANNQLLKPEVGDALFKRGIFYAPDYLVNAGGLIHVGSEGADYDEEKVVLHIEGIYQTLKEVIRRSQNVAPHRIVDKMAEERLHFVPCGLQSQAYC